MAKIKAKAKGRRKWTRDDKEFEGDKKTPEGLYINNDKNPNSGYHKNLGISYPKKDNIENAKRLGKPTGGDVKIHGLRNKTGFISKFHRWSDWTLGCIAVTDEEIDELYNAVKIGTKIEIKPWHNGQKEGQPITAPT